MSIGLWAPRYSEVREKDIPSTPAAEHSISPTNWPNRPPSCRLVPRNPSEDREQILPVGVDIATPKMMQPENEPSMKNPISLRGRSRVSLSKNLKDSIDCSFNIEHCESSVVLEVLVANKLGSFSNQATAPGVLLPVSDSPRSMGHCNGTTNSLWILKHCFQQQARPIPHILYPDVEGPTEEPDAPYTITFKEPQYISFPKSQCRAESLVYIFDDHQDRIILCEKIFGKRLLTSVGADKIILDGQEVSHISAISLWLDDTSQTRSVTFFSGVAGKRSPPEDKDVELKVHDPCNARTTTQKNAVSLHVVAESMPRTDDDDPETSDGREKQQSSAKSGKGFFGRASTARSQKWEKTGKLKCVIECTRSSDRALLCSHLR